MRSVGSYLFPLRDEKSHSAPLPRFFLLCLCGNGDHVSVMQRMLERGSETFGTLPCQLSRVAQHKSANAGSCDALCMGSSTEFGENEDARGGHPILRRCRRIGQRQSRTRGSRRREENEELGRGIWGSASFYPTQLAFAIEHVTPIYSVAPL